MSERSTGGPRPTSPGESEAATTDRLEAESVVQSATRIVADDGAGGHARAVLPTVLSDVPVAILLIDLAQGTVTFANQAAVAMATGQRLPMPLDAWGASAGLTDVDGRPLASTASPLSRIATGRPVTGEAVRIRPTPDSDDTGRVMWVSGFPLSGAASDDPLALVVLLEVAGAPASPAGPDATLALLRDRAIIATDLAFTITDPHRDDGPLVWVNPAFTRVTGYSAEESVGRNCRFLQGPATDPRTVTQLRTAIEDQRPVTVTLLNYRKDGTAFWNQLSVSPVFDGDGRLISFVGVQADVTERVRAEDERERAYAAERVARREAEEARRRLALLADATAQLAATLDVDETLGRLADLVVPSLADWVVINLVDAQGELEQVVGKHRSGQERLVARYAELARDNMTDHSGTRRILDGSDPILIPEARVDAWRDFVTSDELIAVTEELGASSLMYVPLVARRRRILGSITFVSGPSERRFDADDLAVAADLGRRAGLTFDNARLYQHEHCVAETLQRSLLPDLPKVDGLEVAVRYLPGDSDVDVGGDFYELLPLPDGSVGFATGDVVGHDLSAAAAMGHLRGLLRACAWNSAESGLSEPVGVLGQVDRLVQGLDVVPLATMLYGRLDRPHRTGGAWRFTYANAGHPAPLLRLPDGSVQVLDAVHDILLGVTEPTARRSASVEVPAGATLVAFTDGLVERRGESIDDGFDRLVGVLAAPDPDPDAIVERLVATLGAERSDDTAVHVPLGAAIPVPD